MKFIQNKPIIYVFAFYTNLISMIGLVSCEKTTYQYTLSDEQLIHIISDIHLSEAMVKNHNATLRDSISNIYYQQIINIHETTREIFEKDFKAMKKNPAKSEFIYEGVEKFLLSKKEKLSKKLKELQENDELSL